MDKEELNRKLAEWAGLHRNEPTGGFWWDKGGNEIFDFHNSNERGFTQSLDACFKWLVPKLHRVTIIQESNSVEVVIQPKYKYLHYKTWAGVPALALCLAIEKLIDGGNKGGESE